MFLWCSEDCTGKLRWFAVAVKNGKKVQSQTQNYCWVSVSEDFKIVIEVSFDGLPYNIFVSTLHLNRIPWHRFS